MNDDPVFVRDVASATELREYRRTQRLAGWYALAVAIPVGLCYVVGRIGAAAAWAKQRMENPLDDWTMLQNEQMHDWHTRARHIREVRRAQQEFPDGKC